MAIYHLHQGIISRGGGRSSVQSAAYIAREKLLEERRNAVADYSKRKEDVLYVNTLAPEYSKYQDISVWNEVEKFENQYAEKHYKTEETIGNYKGSAQTATMIIVALPNELSVETNKELLERFINTRFTNRGLVSTYAIHKNEGNLHAHIQTTRRAIDEDTGEFRERKDREICTKSALIETRKLWADLANEYLAREGLSVRINEKSFADLGVDLEPTKHKGWYGNLLGDRSRIERENEEARDVNQEKILSNPEVVIGLLNANQAVFTQKDILKELNKRMDNEDQISEAFEGILKEAVYIGENAKGELLYTGQKYLELESDTLTKFEELSQNMFEEFRDEMNIDNNVDLKNYSDEQKEAIKGLVGGGQVGVLVGKAGAGKTTAMSKVAEIYKERGRRVIGMSLSAVASENLGKDADIDSKTIASWTHEWRCYEIAKEKFLSFREIIDRGILEQLDWYRDLKRYEGSQLRKGDVIIVDEAGMVGTKNWHEILESADRFGAKVIAVGDSNQFEAISAGDCFRKFTEIAKEKGRLFELNEIRRQKEEWMKDASIEFSKLNTIEGLTKYENHGNVREFETKEEAIKFAAEEYVDNQVSAILCYKRETCRMANEEVRNLRREKGEIGKDIAVIGGRNFAINEEVMFLQNNRSLGVKNGLRGRIIAGNEDFIKIKTEDNREVEINVETYDKLEHGYAMTLHKSQGKTFENVMIIAEKGMDAKATYVGMTRHRENVDLIYSKEEFKSFKSLSENLSRCRQKDLISDYQEVQNENKERVLQYQDCYIEMASVLKDINQGIADWREYVEIKKQANELGREIHQRYETHKLYLEQIGITKEKLEIRLGIRLRPLTKVEQNARESVRVYGEICEETRKFYQHMKSEKYNVMEHYEYGRYCDLRKERNELAREILKNYAIHRPFVKEFAREYYISKRTMESQIDYADNVLNRGKEEKWNDIDTRSDTHSEPKYISMIFVNEYKNDHPAMQGVAVKESTLQYANMVLNQNLEKDAPLTDLMRDAIKQALCFELVKENCKNHQDRTTKDIKEIAEIHKIAELISSRVKHVDFNQYSFEKAREMVMRDMDSNSDPSANSNVTHLKNIEKLAHVIEKEDVAEAAKQAAEMQRQLERSRDRGIER